MGRVRHATDGPKREKTDYDNELSFSKRYLMGAIEKEGNAMGMATSVLKNNANENVNHPPHYNSHPSGVECIDIIEHWSYNLGAAVKYIWRAGLKPGADHVEDLQKAVWYIEREIKRLDPDVEFK